MAVTPLQNWGPLEDVNTAAATGVTQITAAAGITLAPNPITTIGTVALTTPVTIANGGTGQGTAPNAFKALAPLTTLGDTLYEDATPAPARLAGNTTATKKFLTQTGTGAVSAAPAWDDIAIGNLPAGILKADGTVPLTALWDAGNFNIKSRNSVNVFNVQAYGAVGDGATDDTVPIQNTIAAASAVKGTVLLASTATNQYKTTATIYVPHGVTIQGQSKITPGGTTNGGPCIVAFHNGAAVISLKGAQGVTLRDFGISSDNVTYPKTGLCLGRSGVGSAGGHHIENVIVQGYFSVASLYNVASEENVFINSWFDSLGGTQTRIAYYSEADTLAVDGMTTASFVSNYHFGVHISNHNAGVTHNLYYRIGDSGSGTWAHGWYGGYWPIGWGQVITVDFSGAGAATNAGPSIIFDGIGMGDSTATTGGVHITGVAGKTLYGLVINNCQFAINAGSYVLHDTITLRNAYISLPPALNGQTSTFGTVLDSYIDAGEGTLGLDKNLGVRTMAPTRVLDVNGEQRHRGIAAPAVSEANSGLIYFDSALNRYRVSMNTGAFVDLVGSAGLTGTGVATKLGYWTNATNLDSLANLYADAVNHRLGVKVAVPAYQIDCDGDINQTTGGVLRTNGERVFQSSLADAAVAVGQNVLGGTTNTDSTAVGIGAAQHLTAGTGNTAVGSSALHATTAGNDNVAVGRSAGLANTTGGNNVLIGATADVGAGNLTNAVAIGFGSNVAVSNGFVLGSAATLVGVRTSSPVVPLDVNGAVATRHLDIALANGLNSDIALTNASWIRITGPVAGFSLGGFTNGVDGRHLSVFNTTANAMTIVNEDAGSVAANRITTLTGGNVVLAARTSAATFCYEDNTDRWILLSYN